MRVINKSENGVQKTITINPITVDEVKGHAYKEDRFQAQLRQVIDSKSNYPSKKVNNDLFSTADFGAEFSEGSEYKRSSTRIAWIDVPKDTTAAQVTAKLASYGEKAVIYQVLSLDVLDVLSANEKAAYNSGLDNCSLEDFQERKMMLNAEGETITTDAGEIIFRGLHFSLDGQEDKSFLPAVSIETISISESSEGDVA